MTRAPNLLCTKQVLCRLSYVSVELPPRFELGASSIPRKCSSRMSYGSTMERPTGDDPVTSALARQRSTNVSYGRLFNEQARK